MKTQSLQKYLKRLVFRLVKIEITLVNGTESEWKNPMLLSWLSPLAALPHYPLNHRSDISCMSSVAEENVQHTTRLGKSLCSSPLIPRDAQEINRPVPFNFNFRA